MFIKGDCCYVRSGAYANTSLFPTGQAVQKRDTIILNPMDYAILEVLQKSTKEFYKKFNSIKLYKVKIPRRLSS